MALCILKKVNGDAKDLRNYKYYEGEPSKHDSKKWPGYVYVGHASGLATARLFIIEMANRKIKDERDKRSGNSIPGDACDNLFKSIDAVLARPRKM